MIKRFIVKVYNFFAKNKSSRRYIICLALIVVALAVAGYFLREIFDNNVYETVIATIFGFALSHVFIYAIGVFGRIFEDRRKVNNNTRDMLKIYSLPEYKKTVTFGDTEATICYNPVIINKDYEFEVEDHEEKMFDLDDFFMQFFTTLYESHASSAKANELTIRLDDVIKTEKGYKFYLSRSNFFNHLITNRAMDYQIAGGLTVRTYFEHGPMISPLKESKLSNHLGINALVYLEDGHVLLPQRKGNSTISKNCLTASIATRLTFPNNKPCRITKEYLFEENIYDNLGARLSIDVTALGKENVEVYFLGLGQNIYEGGKPQAYFIVHLKGVTRDNFTELCLKKKESGQIIDIDKRVLMVDSASIRVDKSNQYLLLNHYDEKKKKYRKGKFVFERSLMCNFWHTQQKEKQDA